MVTAGSTTCSTFAPTGMLLSAAARDMARPASMLAVMTPPFWSSTNSLPGLTWVHTMPWPLASGAKAVTSATLPGMLAGG